MLANNSYRLKAVVRDSWHTRNKDRFSYCLGSLRGFIRGVMFTTRSIVVRY